MYLQIIEYSLEVSISEYWVIVETQIFFLILSSLSHKFLVLAQLLGSSVDVMFACVYLCQARAYSSVGVEVYE